MQVSIRKLNPHRAFPRSSKLYRFLYIRRNWLINASYVDLQRERGSANGVVGPGRRARAARATARAAAAPHARAAGAAGTLRLRGVQARRLLATAAGLLPQTSHRRGARPHRRAKTRSRPVFH